MQQQQQEQAQGMAVSSRVLLCVLLGVLGLQAYGYGEQIDSKCSSYVELGLPPPEGLLFSHACPKPPGWWTRFLLLWAPVNVNVECNHASYKVVSAHSEKGLNTSATAVLCGFQRDWSPKNCSFTLSPLRNTYFAVQPKDTGLFFIGPRNLECSVLSSATDNSHLRLHWVFATVVAIVVFWYARVLVDSLTFRLTSGAVMGICAVVLAFFYIFMRSAPYKRQVGAALAVSTSSTVAFMRWFFGVWFPGVNEIVHSPPFYIAIGVTGLLGAALAYWFDRPEDIKLMNMFTFGLRLTASGAMFATLSDWRVAAGIDAALWSALLVGPVCSFLYTAYTAMLPLLSPLAALLRWALGIKRAAAAPPAGRRVVVRRAHQPIADDGVSLVCSEDDYQEDLDGMQGADGGPAQQVRFAFDEGYDEDEYEDESEDDADYDESSEEEEEEEEEQGGEQQGRTGGRVPAASLQQPQAPAPVARGMQGLWQWGSSAAAEASGAARARAQPPPVATAQPADAAAGSSRQQAAGGAAGVGAGSSGRALAPVHKPPPSPDAKARLQQLGQGGLAQGGWSPPKVVLDLKQRGTPDKQQPQQQQQQQGSAGRWGTAQVAFDVNRRPPQQVSPVGPAAAAAAAGSGGHVGVSPMASPGKITNPETGREISIGGPKYKELLSRGFVPDLARNTLLPPPSPRPGAAAAAAGRAGAPAASPASNLRHRAHGTPQ